MFIVNRSFLVHTALAAAPKRKKKREKKKIKIRVMVDSDSNFAFWLFGVFLASSNIVITSRHFSSIRNFSGHKNSFSLFCRDKAVGWSVEAI